VKLHILTAVTRPENLPAVDDSILDALHRTGQMVIHTHRRFDPDREFVGGQRLKNDMLDEITDGWVVILDDDTLMHERFLQKIELVEATQELAQREIRAIIVSQKRVNGIILRASSENAVVGMIDAGQAVLRRDLIGDYRIPEEYAGDGMWLETLLRDRWDVHYMKDVLSLHNAISGVDVGPVTA
jgi:hypothetical protein